MAANLGNRAKFGNEDMEDSDQEIDDQMNNCKVCMKPFNKLLAHLRFQEVCRNGYAEMELEELKQKQASKRKVYKAKSKHDKELKKKPEDTSKLDKCKVCQRSFKNINGHFRFNPDHKERYSEAELSKINLKFEQNKKDYFSNYHKSHPADWQMKKVKTFDNKLDYALNRSYYGTSYSDIDYIFTGMLIFKRNGLKSLQAEVVTLLNELVGETHELHPTIMSLYDKVDETSKSFDDIKKSAMSYLKSKNMRISDSALTDLARNLQQFMRDTFSLAKNQLNFAADKLKTPTEDHYNELVSIVKIKTEDFANEVRKLKGDYLEKFLEVQVFDKLYKIKGIQGDILVKMKNYLQMKFKSHLDSYSAWIPKYQKVLDEHYDDSNEILSLMQTCEGCIEYCKNYSEELKDMCDQSYIREGYEKSLLIEVRLLASIYFSNKEATEVLLRIDRNDLDKHLKLYGYNAEYTDSEVCLGFGKDPNYDVIKYDDINYLRKDETQIQLGRRIELELLTFLKDLPVSDWM